MGCKPGSCLLLLIEGGQRCLRGRRGDNLLIFITVGVEQSLPPVVAFESKNDGNSQGDSVDDHISPRSYVRFADIGSHDHGKEEESCPGKPHFFGECPEAAKEKGGPGPALLHGFQGTVRVLKDFKLFHRDKVITTRVLEDFGSCYQCLEDTVLQMR